MNIKSRCTPFRKREREIEREVSCTFVVLQNPRGSFEKIEMDDVFEGRHDQGQGQGQLRKIYFSLSFRGKEKKGNKIKSNKVK